MTERDIPYGVTEHGLAAVPTDALGQRQTIASMKILTLARLGMVG